MRAVIEALLAENEVLTARNEPHAERLFRTHDPHRRIRVNLRPQRTAGLLGTNRRQHQELEQKLRAWPSVTLAHSGKRAWDLRIGKRTMMRVPRLGARKQPRDQLGRIVGAVPVDNGPNPLILRQVVPNERVLRSRMHASVAGFARPALTCRRDG